MCTIDRPFRRLYSPVIVSTTCSVLRVTVSGNNIEKMSRPSLADVCAFDGVLRLLCARWGGRVQPTDGENDFFFVLNVIRVVLLRGAIVNRTCGIHKNLYI